MAESDANPNRLRMPNLRKFFRPDPGMMLGDADLSGADAQVVAWEAEDEDLKSAFRAGIKIHAHNAKKMFGDKAGPDGKKMPFYQDCKQGCHAVNYGAGPAKLAATVGYTKQFWTNFRAQWFALHPGIHRWHKRVETGLYSTRTISNRFGYRIVYFDRLEGLLPEALAWIAQGSVAITCIKGSLRLRAVPKVQILMQIHDSLIFQYPLTEHPHILPAIHKALHIPIPYDDPLIIPWGLKLSDRSWGDARTAAWETGIIT